MLLGILLLIGFYYWSSCSVKKIKNKSEAPDTVFANVKYIYKHRALSAVLNCYGNYPVFL